MVFLRTVLFFSTVALLAQEPSFETLREQGRWKQLRPRVEGWYRSKPEDPYAMLWMSRLKQAFGEPEAALELARKAAKTKADDSDIQAQLGMAAAETAGRTEGKMKQFSLARGMKKALETALAAKPGDEKAAKYLVQFYLQAPGIVGGSVSKAKEVAQQVTQSKPAEGLLLQADVAYYNKDMNGARSLIQQSIDKDGKCYSAHLYMANYHLRQKPQALDAALACYRQALSANPKGIYAHAQIAAILAEQGKWSELETSLAQAKRTVPDNLLPYYFAGWNLITENKSLEKVEPLLRTYLSAEPEASAPDHAQTHWQIGLLFEKQGRKSEAIQEMELAIKMRPTLKAAQKDLERLKKG